MTDEHSVELTFLVLHIDSDPRVDDPLLHICQKFVRSHQNKVFLIDRPLTNT